MKLPDSSHPKSIPEREKPNPDSQPMERNQETEPGKRLDAILAASRQTISEQMAPKKPAEKIDAVYKPAQKRNSRRAPGKFRLQVEKIPAAYWTVTGSLSLIVNAILIAILILLSREIFFLKRSLVGNVLGGLENNFALMDQAHIQANVPVSLDVPLDLQIPINLVTDITITQDTFINDAPVKIYAGIITIDGPADIILPAGTVLPIQLNMVVPYQHTLSVATTINIDIPLDTTQLHQPFVGLQNVVKPYVSAFWQDPFYWEQLPVCQSLRSLCDWWFR